MTGDDTGTEETPSPEEETTSLWQGEPQPFRLVVAGVPIDGYEAGATLRSA